MSAFHTYPRGRAEGNHWGTALTPLITSARSLYSFDLHASDPQDPDGGSRKDIGHTLLCGPTGSGKTVFLGFLVAMLTRKEATQVIFDKDRGLEILVRALGGRYLPLKNGVPTGFNPRQLPDSADNWTFLGTWLRRLVERPEKPLTVRQETDLDQALAGTVALSHADRRLSRLLEFLDPTDPEGIYARLAPWCASTRGTYAWVFDHPEDQVVALLEDASIMGFDVTDFLNNDTTRVPVTLYLFHLVKRLLDGRRLVVWMDEFARLLGDRGFEAFANDGLKTWRKINAVAVFATQSPSDVLASPISRTLSEQTPTKVFFPNADANREDYIGGLGLSEREFELIRTELAPGSRQFLIKQGHQSVVCELNLKGFDVELNVISGRTRNVELMTRLIEELGADPDRWLPSFGEALASPTIH